MLLMILMCREIRKEYWRILVVKESPMWERRGAASKDNYIRHNSLETLAEPGKMSMAKTDITMRIEECQGGVLCEIYHHLHKRQIGSTTSRLPLVSKVNIFSQEKVQRIKLMNTQKCIFIKSFMHHYTLKSIINSSNLSNLVILKIYSKVV